MKYIGIIRVGRYTPLKDPITPFIGPTKAPEIYPGEPLRDPNSSFTRALVFILKRFSNEENRYIRLINNET